MKPADCIARAYLVCESLSVGAYLVPDSRLWQAVFGCAHQVIFGKSTSDRDPLNAFEKASEEFVSTHE